MDSMTYLKERSYSKTGAKRKLINSSQKKEMKR